MADLAPHIKVGDNVLVTTDGWFYGPSGRQYKSVWGTVKSVQTDEQSLGIKTNMRSTNWYMVVGDMLIAGCQVHYVCKCNFAPPDFVDDFSTADGILKEFRTPSTTLNANEINNG